MHEKIAELKDKLEQIHTSVEELQFPHADLVAWNSTLLPAIHTHDLALLMYDLKTKASRFKKFIPSSDDIVTIDSILSALENCKINIPNLTNANVNIASQSIHNFLLTMFYVSNSINELFSFETLKDRSLLPKAVINRLSLYEDNLEEIKDKAGNIENKIKTILEAYDAAEGLPTTVKALRKTNEELENLQAEATLNSKTIEEYKNQSESYYDELVKKHTDIYDLAEKMHEQIHDYMQSYQDQAQTYIESCEIAFRTTTTKGLAGAFQDKAQKLNASIRWWVGGLMGALVMGAGVGYFRLKVLEEYLLSDNESPIKLLVQLFLALLSVGAPLWFAWLATKQIGQRFRLAEDYEFKASVSKAYEGYRKEAVTMDDSFAQRLFGNALTRLEEPPLRFVEENTHSSPLMEILNSVKFRDFVAKSDKSIDVALQRAGLKRSNSENDNFERDIKKTTPSISEAKNLDIDEKDAAQ
ncbi:hypothetical protein [Erwinia sp. 9145]|uniref:hypothetical protein n=1 Tax=Erwinia sp. 9145 TaxID=1500895 RepID=UPI000907B3B0|nr:hypothetical protein [Erwinia sp. 9145]